MPREYKKSLETFVKELYWDTKRNKLKEFPNEAKPHPSTVLNAICTWKKWPKETRKLKEADIIRKISHELGAKEMNTAQFSTKIKAINRDIREFFCYAELKPLYLARFPIKEKTTTTDYVVVVFNEKAATAAHKKWCQLSEKNEEESRDGAKKGKEKKNSGKAKPNAVNKVIVDTILESPVNTDEKELAEWLQEHGLPKYMRVKGKDESTPDQKSRIRAFLEQDFFKEPRIRDIRITYPAVKRKDSPQYKAWESIFENMAPVCIHDHSTGALVELGPGFKHEEGAELRLPTKATGRIAIVPRLTGDKYKIEFIGYYKEEFKTDIDRSPEVYHVWSLYGDFEHDLQFDLDISKNGLDIEIIQFGLSKEVFMCARIPLKEGIVNLNAPVKLLYKVDGKLVKIADARLKSPG